MLFRSIEKVTVDNTTTLNATTANVDLLTGAVTYYTVNAGANFNFNIRGSSTLSLNNTMVVGQSATVALLTTQGSTAYYPTALTIDGVSVSVRWQGGATPASGNALGIDVYTYTIIKTASATWTVLGSQTQFKA